MSFFKEGSKYKKADGYIKCMWTKQVSQFSFTRKLLIIFNTILQVRMHTDFVIIVILLVVIYIYLC